MSATRKAKQFLVVIIKLLIVGGAFYFIYDRLANNEQLDWSRFAQTLERQSAYLIISVILFLTFMNRFLEIVKWKNLVSALYSISLGRSAKEVLAAVTTALFTPNGIGEYAAKALYYKKSEAGEIVFLNLICNGIQLIIAVVAGLAGLFYFNYTYPAVSGSLALGILSAIVILVFVLAFARKITIKGYSIKKFGEKLNTMPKEVHRKNIILAILRYLTIIHQYYLLFLLFDIQLPYAIMISTIAATYFLGSSLPSFQFLDFAVKGSVAVFFFGILGVNEWVVVFTATLIWLLNTVLPVTIGSYFVFTFKTLKEEPTSSYR
ncbi:lysylphosphatidylglycerol synthase domain-containing protein [Flavobacterium sp. DG1-102-2]|uniref:lysylphosphatidylglycerol synthase domain-containing protein n=1 Tax=Flavobacterium sp. DG1-102-2 TaxID=3081663 RepID=UPI002948D0E4|nr:lysylphosphatidylglycerol synthase domain-containing protein [Flavobacterium sp. DG1-102-2]MDV6169356.1 lysylphosphatidylglycerol synthase domain-containing protein [Flavobacterium sp. DG1-102-2]